MKTLTRIALALFAGFIVAGCANQTAKIASPAVPRLASWGERPLSARDYWLQREFDDRIDRARENR